MQIGELAERTGVPSRMLRYYESQGLIHPERAENGYRQFAASDVDRVRSVRSMIACGMPTRLVRAVLDMQRFQDAPPPECSTELAASLQAELDTIEDRMACLARSRETIAAYLDRARITASQPTGRQD